MIAAADGGWSEKVLIWMNPNVATPTETISATINKMISGGRYQVTEKEETVMGMPFEGMPLLGYDNIKKKFTYTRVDNLGTGTMTLEGDCNDATKSIELKGKTFEPTTGKHISMRQNIKFIDNDIQEMQIFDPKNDNEKKTMEIKMIRKK